MQLSVQVNAITQTVLLSTTTTELLRLDYPARYAGALLCPLPLKRRSWHHTAQQMRTSLLVRAAVAL